MVRLLRALTAFAVVAPLFASAQVVEPVHGLAAGVDPAAGDEPWSFSLSLYQYFEPDDADYLQPTVAVDRGPFHLEARSNYEDIDTASLWLGVNLRLHRGVDLEFTPMVGVVVGATDGAALGLKLSVGWRCLELTSEAELVADSSGSDGDFFYSWSDLSVWPWDRFGAGVAEQRTRLRGSGFVTELGVLVAVAWNDGSITVYVFGLEDDEPTVIVGADLSF